MITNDQLDINDFEVIQRIGSGTFAEVYIVKEKKTGHLYAAKIPLKPIDEYNDGEIKDIGREFSIMCKLNHPSILKMIGYCSKNFNNEEKPTIITEYLPNGTLSQVLELERKQKQPDNWDDTKKLITLYGIAAAMNYLHENNVIHRDLKPSNILMDGQMHPRIGDFGVSKITKANENSINQSTVNTKGTPIYMPPELWEDNNYSSAGDVYAFGMIVYEVMTSQIPYCNYKNIHARKLSKMVINGIRPDMDFEIDDSYRELIESCWHQESTMRPTFKKIVDELRNNPTFITKNVDQTKYFDYIKSIDDYNITFDSKKQNITIEDYDKLKTKLNPSLNNISFSNSNSDDHIDINDFEVIQRIGSGSFAEVFIVKEKKTSNLYAAKIPLKPINEFHTEEIKDIGRELSIMCKINHPTILKMIGYSLKSFKSEDKPTIFTEYLSNGTLFEIIELERKNEPRKDWNDTTKLCTLYGIASAMNYLHSNDIIHRDLKTKNILMDNQMHPKIGDFGVSKKIKDKENGIDQSTLIEKGTPIYMPPELMEHNIYSKSGDVYAFGMIAYEVMTSQIPFSSYRITNAHKLSRMVISGNRPDMNFDIGESYKELIKSCWHQESTMRPTFKEIVDELRNNSSFITKNVDRTIYLDYIKYIDDYNITFDSIKQNISLDEMINSQINPESYFSDDEKLGKYYYELAQKYYNGIGVPVDREKAAQNYILAADKNHLDAKFIYGNMLFNGDGIPQNQEKGVQYIREASEIGHIDAMYIFASMLENGKGISGDKTLAAELYLMAAKRGHPDAQFAYGKMLEEGLGVNINKYKSFEYMKMAALNDHTEAIYNYGLDLHNGYGTIKNRTEGVHYLKLAADKGHPESIMTYCSVLYNGNGVEINKTEAANYYKIAADRGIVDSMYIIAGMYYNGDGVDVDKNKGNMYYKLAANKGHTDAMYKYGSILFENDKNEEDMKNGARFIKMAADKGHASAMYKYGIALFDGKGVSINKKEAIEYLKKGANNGNKDCMYKLGVSFLFGEGVEINREEGAKYFQMYRQLI